MKKFSYNKSETFGWNLGEFSYYLAEMTHIASSWLVRFLIKISAWFFRLFPWSCKLSILAAITGGLLVNAAVFAEPFYLRVCDFDNFNLKILHKVDAFSALPVLQLFALFFGIILVVSALLSFVRTRFSLLLLKVGASGFMVTWLWILLLIYQIPAVLMKNAVNKSFESMDRNHLWYIWTWQWVPFFIIGVIFLFCLILRSTKAFYTGKEIKRDLIGDRILENLNTNGEDPAYRTSFYWSVFLHFFFIILLPLLLWFFMPTMEAYRIQKGDGAVVQYIKVKPKKKPKEKYVFNPNSAISYYRPKLDDRISEEIDEDTKLEYQPTAMGKKSKKGGRPGWPNGMEDAKVRFIRLKYTGGDWDQDLGKGSDYNLLLKIRDTTGFRIADNTEAINIRDLKRFPKNYAPPFVYITGKGNINASSRDIKTLRWYLIEEGGMLFADNGGGNFNAAIRRLISRIFPDKSWIDISNDDILYRHPYVFPNGAPPLWHHSGNRALGIKHNGRWVVFYHQGDINDAWKTGGSGASENVREQAFKMGINVINYSFTQYLQRHFGE